MSYTFPSVTINDVTYTARRWGQFPTITYVAAEVEAGSETVTLASDLSNITVGIEDGVSTNAQIKAAIEAALGTAVQSLYATDLVTVAIAEGGEDTPADAVTAQAMTGASATPPPTPAVFIPPLLRVDPINPNEGDVWFNTTSHLLKYFDGTDVQVVAVVA